MPVKSRVMADCIVITTQNTRELWGCAEGLSVAKFSKRKMNQWIKAFPGVINDTDDDYTLYIKPVDGILSLQRVCILPFKNLIFQTDTNRSQNI